MVDGNLVQNIATQYDSWGRPARTNDINATFSFGFDPAGNRRFEIGTIGSVLIIDWQLFADQPPCDSKLLKPTLIRLEKHYGVIGSSCADRAFSAQQNDLFLQKHKIYNAICPRSPKQLQEKLSDPRFLSLQTRRSQIEARIGIFKNVFLGKPLRSRINVYKKIAITWCVLTHNLWLLSRKALDIERSMLKKVA